MTERPGDPAAAMAGWAQLLHDVVERRLRPDPATDLLAPSWDGMFDDALAAVMRDMVASRLEQLSSEQFVATYRAVHGDDALLRELDRLVAARARDARRAVALLRLAADARRAGRLRLADLDPDETVEISLFDPTTPGLANRASRVDTARRPLHRVLRVRLTVPATGEGRVVSDTWTGAVWAERWRTPLVVPMTAARIGTRFPEADGPAPELTWHAPVLVALDDGTVMTPPQIVGDVSTLDGRVLLGAV